MAIKMPKLSDKTVEKILDDRIDRRLVVSKYYLNKIIGKFNLDGGWDHFYFTTNLDSFVFFASNAIEIISREINNEFSLINENEVSIYKIKKQLDQNIENQNKIIQLISKYFENPHNGKNVDYSHSSLWCLRELRNIIAHGKTLIRTVSSGSSYYGFIIPYPIREQNNKIIGVDRIEIFDTDKYFTNMYNDLEVFCDSVKQIIPKKYHSYQHKNQLNFEL